MKKKLTSVAKTTKKTTPKKIAKPMRKNSSRASSKKQIPTQDQIAIRAYFISERRQQLGWNGDSLSDWIDAEQQLITEAEEY